MWGSGGSRISERGGIHLVGAPKKGGDPVRIHPKGGGSKIFEANFLRKFASIEGKNEAKLRALGARENWTFKMKVAAERSEARSFAFFVWKIHLPLPDFPLFWIRV